jgi:hypothetical protein
MNANCAACRLAKTKCDRVQPTCARCSRLGIACVYDERRSRWDAGNVKMAPAAVAQDPAYAALASSLAKFKPGVRCFRARIFEQLRQLVELAIQKDDAVAISWATSLMHEHGFLPSDFPTFRRDSGTARDVNEPLAADANFGSAPTLALAFFGTHPAFGWVQVGNLEKQVFTNAAFPVDACQLQEAESLESQAELCGVHRLDYVRGAEQCYAAIGAEIARIAARGGGGEESLLVLPPRPCRMLVRSADSPSTEKRFRLFIVHTHIHISRGGNRVAGVVQYAPAPSTKGGGSGGSGQKRKAIDELNGLFTDTQLDEWLHEVGGSDAMLEGLLGL